MMAVRVSFVDLEIESFLAQLLVVIAAQRDFQEINGVILEPAQSRTCEEFRDFALIPTRIRSANGVRLGAGGSLGG